MATSATARSDGGRPKNVWELVESNLEVFNVKKLLQILVPLSSMDKVGKADQRIVRLLQRAMKYVEGGGAIVSVVGAKEAAAIVQVTQRLGTKEAKRFNLSWLGAMTAQVNDLPVDLVAQLTQELLVSKVSDRELWHALVETTTKRSHEMGPAEIVCLMDGFRRSYNAFGTEPHRAVQALCQRTLECCQDFLPRHCVGTLGSVCRMGALLYNWQRYQVLHHLLDKWLVCQGPSWETTPSNQVVSVAVSLNSAPEIMNPRIGHFLDGASSWAEHDAVAGGALSAEDFVVLLWALKQLTPVGLSRYPKLVSLALPRIRDKAEYKNFTLVRKYQALEVLLASKHALVDSQGTGISYEDILKTMEPPLVAALAKKVAEAPIDLLGKVLTIGSQGDVDFWQRCSLLTEAVLRRAVELTSNQDLSPETLHPLLDTIASSPIASASAFRGGCDALSAAVGKRPDASHIMLVSVLRVLDKATAKTTAPITEEREKPKKSEGGFDAERPLSPLELSERLGKLGKAKSKAPGELAMVADRFMAAVDGLSRDQLLPALQNVLLAGRQRINREPLLLEVVEHLADQVAMHCNDLSSLQLISALDLFADLGLPYHLLFESVLVELLERKQPLSWQQVITVMEAFAVVRIRIPELSQIYQRQRRQQELARLPTMGMVRFLSSATRLDLVDEAGFDVREMISRILAETSPDRPLPQEHAVSIIESLLASGVVPPDMQLRHILSWIAKVRPGQLADRDLATLRHYSFFILAQVEGSSRFTLQRMPVEMQTHISDILCHRSPAWSKPLTEQTRRLRAEVSEMLLAEDPAVPMDSAMVPPVSLGPLGQADAEVNETVLLLDGPEAFFRPFGETKDLRYTPQERQRDYLMRRMLSSDTVRQSCADFFPAALQWPKKRGPHRINWQEWGQGGLDQRRRLLGLVPTEPGTSLHSGQRVQAAAP